MHPTSVVAERLGVSSHIEFQSPRAVRHAKLLQFIGNESGDVDGRRRDGRFNRGNLSE